MKITTLTAEELELNEGGLTGKIVGAGLIVFGIVIGIVLNSETPFALLIAAALAVAGILTILFSSSITVNASKRTGQLRYQKKRIVGTKDLLYNVNDVFRIETRKTWRMQSTGTGDNNQGSSRQQPVLVAQSVIIFKNGSEQALCHESTSAKVSVGSVSLSGGQSAQSAMASQVAQFLNVPFQEIMPPNMSSGINVNFYGGAGN